MASLAHAGAMGLNVNLFVQLWLSIPMELVHAADVLRFRAASCRGGLWLTAAPHGGFPGALAWKENLPL